MNESGPKFGKGGCRGGGSGHRVQRPVVYKDPDESNLRSHPLPLWGRQTIWGDRTYRPSARRGQRHHERSWAKRVFISSLHTSRSKVHEEGHPSCQARTGENSCVHTALLQTALLHTNALRQSGRTWQMPQPIISGEPTYPVGATSY